MWKTLGIFKAVKLFCVILCVAMSLQAAQHPQRTVRSAVALGRCCASLASLAAAKMARC